MIEKNFDLEKYLSQLRLSSSLTIGAVSQTINIGAGATYELLLSTKPRMYSIERSAHIYSDLPRSIDVEYLIDDSQSGSILPLFRLLEPKKEIFFLSKWLKGSFIKFRMTNIHTYMSSRLVLQAFPEYIDMSRMESMINELMIDYGYNINLPIGRYEPTIMNFAPNYRCTTCLSGARITFNANNNISALSFQDGRSYQPNSSTYFWGGGHDCPLLQYTNKSQILLAITEGKIEAI